MAGRQSPDGLHDNGLDRERVASHYEITREECDQFALRSHQRALHAIENGYFADEIVPVSVTITSVGSDRKTHNQQKQFAIDEGPRGDTTIEALAKLRTVFHAKGVVTAGNSSQMSDGAAATVMMSATRAHQLGIKPLLRFVAFATAGCLPEEMGIGPIYAVPQSAPLAGLSLEDIDLIELNEAFATQTLAVMKVLGMDPRRSM